MSSNKSGNSTKKIKSTKLLKPFYGRKFLYTGNIAHIKAYIDKNTPGKRCTVKIYVAALTKAEREIWSLAA